MKNLITFVFVLFFFVSSGQQISIPRVDEMPDFPQPYEMRDWKNIALYYDSLVFDLNAEGQYFPLATVFENTTNYTEHAGLAIQSYVGTNSPPGKEAINVLPAVVGASLSGVNKADQNGINWPLLCEEYFNKRPEENVYLNGPVSSSGNDWWYETMPNIFFYQLNDLYPNTGDFNFQVTALADRWLEAVLAMGGNTTPWEKPYMNYRAFKLSTMTPNESGVKQPEAAGAIGWILFEAFQITGEDKYRIGAELCLEFLSDWNSNPSYEIQLPYGVYAAARMNAELGTGYDIEKMVNWCFDRGDLRGWGVIVGGWNGNDMDGLIGEVNATAPDYVFHMNSLEHVGALVPMTRYDDRFATTIAKWVLNAANASRFYYSEFLEDNMQDNKEWTSEYDKNAAIAYESLREKNNGPYGTGDAMGGGWAQTNLGLYGSSHVGIFGGIIEKTNIEGILQLDLLATDYYGGDAYPTYLYYNPYDVTQNIQLDFQDAVVDIYDMVSNQVIMTNATDVVQVSIPALSSRMLVILPMSSEVFNHLNISYVGGVVIDYNAGQVIDNYPPRVKALSVIDSIVETNTTVSFYCSAEDNEDEVLDYLWAIDDVEFDADDVFTYQIPNETGYLSVNCKVTDGGGLSDSATVTVKIVEKINYPPVIESISAEDRILDLNGSTAIYCLASDENNDELTYKWSSNYGTIEGSGSEIDFIAPDQQENIYLVCEVSDTDNASDIDSLLILVRDPSLGQTGDLVAHYEFSDNAKDLTGKGHDGIISGCSFHEDMHGIQNEAISFDNSGSKVTITNEDDLNFQDGLTVSYWIKINKYYDRESYPISHGNWTTRWKTSLTEEKIRFTVNGSDGTSDVDSDMKLMTENWYHVVGVYNGFDLLLFIDGELSGFKPFEGKINKTIYDLVLGQSLPDQSGFNYNGLMDKLRIYNYGISYEEIKDIYESEISSIQSVSLANKFEIYPNPASEIVYLRYDDNPNTPIEISLIGFDGKMIHQNVAQTDHDGNLKTNLNLAGLSSGSYVIMLKVNGETISKSFVVR